MIKTLLLAAVSLAVLCGACKKSKHEGNVVLPKPQSPTTPTSDFRSKYTGTFHVSHNDTSYLRPPNGSTQTYISASQDTMTITYNIADSIDHIRYGSPKTRRPAITLKRSSGSQDTVGIDSLGTLYWSTSDPNQGKGGKFITPDSLEYRFMRVWTSQTIINKSTGIRIP